MKIQLAKTGLANNGISISLQELQQAVKNFKDSRPISIDHIKTGKEPKYGEVKSLELKGNVLIGEIELLPEVKKLFDKGLYNKWSSGFKKNPANEFYLHHLALLGAQPPAIEGLQVLNFSDDLSCDIELEYNFNDLNTEYNYKFSVIGNILRRLREWFISKYGLEEADKISSNWSIDDVREPVKEDTKIFFDKLGDKIMTTEKEVELQKQLDEERLKNKNFSDEIFFLKKKERDFKKEELRKIMTGKVPKEKIDMVLEFADKIDTEPKEFSDKTQKNYFDVITELVNSLPNMVQVGEANFSDNLSKSEDLKIQEIIKKI